MCDSDSMTKKKERKRERSPFSPRCVDCLLQRHRWCNVGHTEAAKWCRDLKQRDFTGRIEDCHGRVPANEDVATDQLDVVRVFELLPLFVNLLHMVRIKFKPQDKQHFFHLLSYWQRW